MKNYYRVMLGKKGAYVQECFAGNYIGVTGYSDDPGMDENLTSLLSDDWRTFNHNFVPMFLKMHPETARIRAGLISGILWTIAIGIGNGENVLCPDGTGRYRIGEVTGNYTYIAGQRLPHRRPVRWLDQYIQRSEMSEMLQRSVGSPGTVIDVSRHREEIERFIGASARMVDESIEDPYAFAMEQHLEDFLVQNWAHTEFGKDYNIYESDGEQVGQQYPTDTGPLDILAISKDKKTLLVVELKKGRASDVVVGQILRYMGYVQEELAEKGQQVRGVIIALEDDQRIRRALAVSPSIEFYRYQVSFKLTKA
jgi:restriction system protein